MRPEYLERKVTLDAKSWLNLCASMTAELVMDEQEPALAAALSLSTGFIQRGMSGLLGLGEEPATIDGNFFTLAAATHLSASRDNGLEAIADNGPSMRGAALHHLGIEVDLLCRLAEKLFGRDKDFEEPPAEKDGDEA